MENGSPEHTERRADWKAIESKPQYQRKAWLGLDSGRVAADVKMDHAGWVLRSSSAPRGMYKMEKADGDRTVGRDRFKLDSWARIFLIV